MVHSEKGPAMRAVFYSAPALGLPKSPSFHSGLDLVAGSHNLTAMDVNDEMANPKELIGNAVKKECLAKDLPLLIGKEARKNYNFSKNSCLVHDCLS